MIEHEWRLVTAATDHAGTDTISLGKRRNVQTCFHIYSPDVRRSEQNLLAFNAVHRTYYNAPLRKFHIEYMPCFISNCTFSALIAIYIVLFFFCLYFDSCLNLSSYYSAFLQKPIILCIDVSIYILLLQLHFLKTIAVICSFHKLFSWFPSLPYFHASPNFYFLLAFNSFW